MDNSGTTAPDPTIEPDQVPPLDPTPPDQSSTPPIDYSITLDPQRLIPLTPDPAALPLPSLPSLPDSLRAPLDPREYRAVLALAAGKRWQQALTDAGYPPKARKRSHAPAARIVAAADWLVQEIAAQAGVNRSFVLANLVSLYRRASCAEEVRDRQGRPIGEWKFDGGTATRCLELLGKQAGMFGTERRGIAPGDVAALLQAVADRGRPPLPGDRARVVDQVPEPAILPQRTTRGPFGAG